MTTRVKGPGAGPPPVDPAGHVDASAPVGEVAPAEVAAVEGAGAADRAAPADPVARVAARLRAGELTVDQAVDALIDDAVRRQVGRAVDDREELEARLREVLRGYADSDPFLAAKIRRLTLGK